MDSRDVVAAHLGRALEALWLATAVFVPIIFVPPEAMLAHIEVPKIALLRGLVCLMAMVWLLEWLVRPGTGWRWVWGLRAGRIGPWLREDPARWVVLALALFLAANVVAAASSTSISVSIWGKRPGGDGYGLYTMLCYAVLFLVVVTHIERPAQLWRLLGAVVGAGVLVGALGILQRYGLDPLLARSVALDRPYSTLGNPVFAGAFLLMTIIMTLTAVFVSHFRFRSVWPLAAVSAVLAVQVLGMVLTLSRGPWIGLAVGLALLFIIIWLSFGAGKMGRVALAALLALGVSLGIALAAVGPEKSAARLDPAQEAASRGAIAERALSIYPAIVGGGVSGRLRIWKGVAQLLRDRPWSDVTPAPPLWVRHLVGYGPEMFRFAYPLRGPPRATAQFAFEAHNYPLNVAVDVGAMGLLSLLAAAAALLTVGFRKLLSAGPGLPATHRVLLAGLLATFVGRGVEMMVGIPKAGDLTLLVLLIAMFVGLSRVNRASEAVDTPTAEDTPSPTAHRATRSEWAWITLRSALVFVAIVALGMFTWVKAVNYARADVVAAQGLAHFGDGERQRGIEEMLRATALAPDAPAYYLLASRMFDTLAEDARSADGRLRMAMGSYVNSRKAVNANELDPAARAAMANTAIALGLQDQEGRFQEAIDLSRGVLAMMPNFAVSHYAVALPHLLSGEADQGLRHIDAGDSLFSPEDNLSVAAQSAFLRGVGYRLQGETAAAVEAFERSLRLDVGGRYAGTAHSHLAGLYGALGELEKASEHDRAAR